MRNLVLMVVLAHFWWTYGRQIAEVQRKKQPSVKEEPAVFLRRKVGEAVTLQCPVRRTVLRMYKYLRRNKSTAKKLEYARRKLALLLGFKYKWYKDGKGIKHHRSAWFMKFQNVQLDDAGVYTCKTVTARGATRKSFTLKVYHNSRPILETRPQNISLKTGQDVALKCTYSNTRDRPQIRWLKWVGKALQYHQFSNDIKTQRLTKFKRSYEIIDPKNYESFPSNCSKGTSGGKQPACGFRLKLRNVKPHDSGTYTCVVRNKFGSDHTSFYVHVRSVAGVAPYPTNSNKRNIKFFAYPAAASMKLKCYVSGDGPLKFQWYKDGKRLLTRRLDPKINTSSWALRLRTLVRSDSGVYSCVVSNPFGVYKHNITLKVVERIRSAPVLQHSLPKNVSAAMNENVSFHCIELIDTGITDYRWLKWHSVPASYPKLDFRNSSQFTLIDPIHYSAIRLRSTRGYRYGGTLTLKNITEDDVGLYTCRVNNIIGGDYSSAFLKLKINDGPQFLPSVSRPSASMINVPATKNLTMNCPATGDPEPQVSWFKDGNPISMAQLDSDHMTITGSSLKLQRLLPQHSGNYTCKVSNRRGSVSHTFRVNIRERLFTRPIILSSLKKAIKYGEKHELKCTVISEEPPDVHWLKTTGVQEQEAIPGKIKPVQLDKYIYTYRYVIPHATFEDNGTYRCVAKNFIGTAQRDFQVEVES